jgi:hypothetical protein
MGIRHFTEEGASCRVSVSHFAIREIFMSCSRVICPKCRMILKDRNGNNGVINAYYEPPVFGTQWAADHLKDKLNNVAYAEFIAVLGEPMIYRHPDLTPLVKIDDDSADEPPMVPAFLANMTDEERKTFVARFNSAKVTSVEPI